MLNQAGLNVAWRAHLPLARGTQIQQLFYHNQQLFVLDSQNVLTALDRNNGTRKWWAALGPRDLPCSKPSFYKNRLLFLLGNIAVEVRQSDGRKTLPNEELEFSFPVFTSIARSRDFLFAGSTDRNFYCVRIANGAVVWKSIRPEKPAGTVVVHNEKVYFVRRDNVLYVSLARRRELLWHTETVGTMPGVVIEGNQCFLPSLDTALYCFYPSNGKLQWKYLAGGSLAELPVITETAVYQSVRYGPLLCLNRKSPTKKGDLRWELPNGKALLAENGSVVYAITSDNELAVIDNVNQREIVSFYLPQTDFYASNTEDATIFLATKDGDIIALEPDRIQKTYNPK